MKKIIAVLVGVLILGIVLGIVLYPFLIQSTSEVSGEQRDLVLQYADPITDSLLEGFNGKDYAMYSRDFNEQMKNALTEGVFLETRELIVSKIGLYVSRVPHTVLRQGPYRIVVYNGVFEQEESVEIRVVFLDHNGTQKVSGLWFNSPKLRE